MHADHGGFCFLGYYEKIKEQSKQRQKYDSKSNAKMIKTNK